MHLPMIQEGRHVYIHPDHAHEVMKLSPWRRHALFHEFCRRVYRRDPKPALTPLADQGIETFRRLLKPKEAKKLSDVAGTILAGAGPDGGAVGPLPGTPDEAVVRVPPVARMEKAVAEVLGKVFRPAVTDALEAYMGCHFRIDHAFVYRTHPVERHLISFLWHRDVAPMTQVHIMVYLTASGARAGETHFLGLDTTREAAVKGYHYTNVGQRLDDMSKILGGKGAKAKIIRPKLDVGDAVAFAAPRVLHRGRLPVKRFRDVLTFVVLPSAVPWNFEIEDFGTGHLLMAEARDTLSVNPFVKFFPPDPDANWEKTRNMTEPWVCLGHLTP